MATIAAATAFQRAWSDPQSMVARNQFAAQVATYDYRWHLYQNSIFDDQNTWRLYRSRYDLYRYIRPIYNPVRRLVDFYAGIIYPGVLATDGKKLPDGTSLAIPLAADIDPALAGAIGQLWQWSNWQAGKNLFVRYGAALGDVAVEVVDEVDRGKVTFDILWPGLIKELELDSTSNVKRYVIEYDAEDDDGKSYTYRKEVDDQRIAEFKDDELFQYDEGIEAERANPYGFAPLVWCKHTDLGGDHGSPAIRNVNKIDELNEMASHAHDRAHAVLSSPIVASGKNAQSLTDAKLQASRGPTQDENGNQAASTGRAQVKVIRTEEGGGMSSVQLPEGEALNYIAKLLLEVEDDHPELVMYKQLRAMSQVTGPGANAMVGDAASYIVDARANYDTQTIKSHQMAIAIAGWRANTGAWGRNLTRQQEAFKPFNLESYQKGDLDFEIMPRPLVPQAILTPDERRALMEQGDRGYSPRAKVIDALGGDSKVDMAAIDAEQGVGLVPEAGTFMATGGAATESAPENIASTVGLNGIQIRAAVDILAQVTNGEISPAIALELLVSLGIERERAQAMVDEAEKFVAANKPAITATTTPNARATAPRNVDELATALARNQGA